MQRTLCFIFFVGMLAMIIWMRPSGQKLVTPFTPYGIFNLELAISKSNVKNILNAWSDTNGGKVPIIAAAKTNIRLDFLFIFFYSLFLFTYTRLITAPFHKKTFVFKWKLWMIPAGLVAGGLDLIENLGMLLNIRGHVSARWVNITFVASALKWGTLLILMLYLIWASVRWFSIKNK
jgi:hypothetical protein